MVGRDVFETGRRRDAGDPLPLADFEPDRPVLAVGIHAFMMKSWRPRPRCRPSPLAGFIGQSKSGGVDFGLGRVSISTSSQVAQDGLVAHAGELSAQQAELLRNLLLGHLLVALPVGMEAVYVDVRASTVTFVAQVQEAGARVVLVRTHPRRARAEALAALERLAL